MEASKPNLSDKWIQHQRMNTKTTLNWACIYCPNRRIFATEQDLWEHGKTDHNEEVEARTGDLEAFREKYAAQSAQKRPLKKIGPPNLNEVNRAQPEPSPLQGKRGHEPNGPPPTTRSISDIRALDINTPRGSEDVPMRDVSDDGQAAEDNRPSKRPAIGVGISAGCRSPYRDSSPSLSPHRPGRPSTSGRRLWQEGQAGPTKSSFNDPSNIASIAAQKARAAQQPQKNRRSFQPQPQPPSFQSSRVQIPHNIPPPPPTIQTSQIPENFDIVLQPETRPISQEQLVAEVKGIYAGLVMVEAKCIAVANCVAMLGFASKDNILMKYCSRHPGSDGVENLLADRTLQSNVTSLPPQNDLQSLEHQLKPGEDSVSINGGLNPLASILRLLQHCKSLLGPCVILGQIVLARASPPEIPQITSAQYLELATVAATLALGSLSIKIAKKCWDIDLILAANIVTPFVCIYVALDRGYSNTELLILWFYGVGLDILWLKDKLLRYSRTAGLVALLLPLLGILSASQTVHKFPGLGSRFGHEVIPIAVLSLPTTVIWSLLWVAVGRTGFAEDLENGTYNPHIFSFIKYIFNTLVLSMIERLIEKATTYFAGEAVSNFPNGAYRHQARDIEADPRGFFSGNEPPHGPMGSDIYRLGREERFSDHWQESPGHE